MQAQSKPLLLSTNYGRDPDDFEFELPNFAETEAGQVSRYLNRNLPDDFYRSLVLQPHLWWVIVMVNFYRQNRSSAPVVTAARLLPPGPAPARPSQPQLHRAWWQGHGHFQQTAHLRNGQPSQLWVWSPLFSSALQRMEANQAWAIMDRVI